MDKINLFLLVFSYTGKQIKETAMPWGCLAVEKIFHKKIFQKMPKKCSVDIFFVSFFLENLFYQYA